MLSGVSHVWQHGFSDIIPAGSGLPSPATQVTGVSKELLAINFYKLKSESSLHILVTF